MDDQTDQVGVEPHEAERAQASGAVGLGRGGRMSRQRKTAAVLRLLRGEDLEIVSRELGVTAATLSGWHDAFLAGGEAALTSRAATGEELESERLKAKLGAALIERDLLNEKIAILEAGRPFARRRPLGAISDEALTTAIRGVLAASPFHGEGHRKVWARLRHAGTRTSLRRVLRLMRQNNLLAPTRVGSPRGPRNHDGTIIPDTLDTMWGTDLTTTITGEGQAAVFVAVDHCSAECVGIHAHARATRFQALEPLRQGVRQHFGGFAQAIARGLAVRHDHGSQYMSDHFQKELTFLGIDSSPAFVRSPQGNGCAERFIGTLKENLLWVRTFETIEELRQALLVFREVYTTTWLIERHGFQTPAAVRQNQLSPAAVAA